METLNIREILNCEYVDLDDIKRNNKKRVIFDTNFLFITFIYKVDIIRELDRILDSYELFVVEHSLDELQKIVDKKKKKRKFIRVIIKFLNTYNFKVIKTNISFKDYYTDDLLLKLVEKGFIVATMDKELRQRIKKNLGRSIIFRQKKYLEVY